MAAEYDGGVTVVVQVHRRGGERWLSAKVYAIDNGRYGSVYYTARPLVGPEPLDHEELISAALEAFHGAVYSQ